MAHYDFHNFGTSVCSVASQEDKNYNWFKEMVVNYCVTDKDSSSNWQSYYLSNLQDNVLINLRKAIRWTYRGDLGSALGFRYNLSNLYDGSKLAVETPILEFLHSKHPEATSLSIQNWTITVNSYVWALNCYLYKYYNSLFSAYKYTDTFNNTTGEDTSSNNMYNLEYTGTTIDVHASNVTIKNSELKNSRTALRVYSSPNFILDNSLLSTAREFLMKIGNDEYNEINLEKNVNFAGLNKVFNGLVVTDPKGELLIETGSVMKKHGYDVKVFDIKNWKGNYWNPFNYFEKDTDILSFVNSLVENTNKGQKGSDPFWDNAAMLLFNSIFFYLKEKCNKEDRNLINVKRLLNLATVSENSENYKSTLDIMIEELEKENPTSKSVEFYKSFKKASGKTLKSIIITCLSRLNFIGLDEVDQMLMYDDMNIQDIGYKKTVLYICIPDDDSSFNFLSGMFIDQVFRVLIRKADNERNKPYIHLFLDEFANIGKLNYFCEKISTIRSRNISTTLVVQNTQQIENLYI